MHDYTETTVTINGIDVKVFGGAKRPIPTYSLPGHVTGWLKRGGARTTYAELTCTCHLTAEAVAVSDGHAETWISYGSEGWVERINALALAHVENVTANGFFVRAAGGDRSRRADRTRTNLAGLRDAGLDAETIERIIAGEVVYTEDGTRYEVSCDRARFALEPLPIS